MSDNIEGAVTGTDNLEQVQLAVNAVINQHRRRTLGGASSVYFNGDRNIYDAVGYPVNITIQQYIDRYKRQDIAERLVNAKPDETWRKQPRILDGSTKDDAKDDTEFVKAWERLSDFASLERDLLSDSRSFWHYFREADRMAQLAGWSVLVLGIGDGNLEAPLPKGTSKPLAYLSVYCGDDKAKIEDAYIVKDHHNKRFGLPEYYSIDFSDGFGTRKVHYSRVIHVSETDDLFGTPELQSVYNRLIDIEKVLAASGESGWRMANRKIIISTRDGYSLGETTVPETHVKELMHDLRDVVGLDGMDVQVIDGQIVDPTSLININLDIIAGSKAIPKRILLGSERGELASSQDETNWYNRIDERRQNLAEPVILRPFIYRLIYTGILPMPSSGSIYIDWPSLYEMDDREQAEVTKLYSETFGNLSKPGLDRILNVKAFTNTFIRGLPEDAVPDEIELLEQEAVMMGDGDDEPDEDDEQPSDERRADRSDADGNAAA